MRLCKFLPMALFLVPMAGCKTFSPAGASTAQGLSFCRKPPTVTFAPAAHAPKPPAMVNGAKVDLGFFDLFHVELTPQDFSRLDSHECKSDGTCTAVLTKPVKVNVNVPVALDSKISLTYQQSQADDSDIALRKVSVGTKFTPLGIGKILSFSVGLGASVTQKDNLATKKVTYNAAPYCNADFSCSLPFLAVGAHMDQHGVTFSNSVSAKTGVPDALVKVSAPVVHSYSVPFASLPDDIKKLKQYFTPTGSTTSATGLALAEAQSDFLDTDIAWEDFAADSDSCGS